MSIKMYWEKKTLNLQRSIYFSSILIDPKVSFALV